MGLRGAMRDFLAQTAPQLRRYAHALLGSWPAAPVGGAGRPRADQDADDLVQQALLGFWRARSEPIESMKNGARLAADPAAFFRFERMRLALYHRVTALARERLENRDLGRPVQACEADEGGAAPRGSKTAQAIHFPWAPEARALPRLSFDLRALLALVTLERLSYEQAAEALDMPNDLVLPRLSVARARLASELCGRARPHLIAADPPPADAPALPGGPATESDLHRFIDNLLGEDRRAEIGLYLESRREAKRRADEWRRNGERLRRAFEPLTREPLPPSLNFFTTISTAQTEPRDGKRRRGIFAGLAAMLAAPTERPSHAQKWF